jgi:type I restriction enzyme S subunit
VSFNAYPAYRDSGAAWLGDVPENWQVLPAKAVFEERKQPNLPDDTHLTPSQKHGVLAQSEYMALTGNKVVLNLTGSDAMRHVEPRDFISHLRSFQGGLELSRLRGKVSAAYTVLAPRSGVVASYFKHLFKSTMYVQALQTTTDQLRDGQSIRYAQFALIPIPVPPSVEQRQIADYLDTQTAKIDALIGKQERLIETLAERRQAVISHAVTKGLDSNAPMTDSGVEWLGKVPNNWAVNRIKMSVQLAKNGVWGDDPDGGADDIWCVRVADFDRSQLTVAQDAKTLRSVARSDRVDRVLQSGDLLLEKSGGGEKSPVGFVALFVHDEPAVCSNFVARVKLISGMVPKFWVYVHTAIYAVRLTQRSIKQTSGIQNLDQSSYFDERAGFPSENEQRAIADHLDRETSQIDALSAKAREMIDVLKERRQALISAAVTGKIDVRGLA